MRLTAGETPVRISVLVAVGSHRELGGCLNVGATDRHPGDQSDNADGRHACDGAIAVSKAAGLAEPIRNRSAERPGEDVGDPERHDGVEVQEAPGKSCLLYTI